MSSQNPIWYVLVICMQLTLDREALEPYFVRLGLYKISDPTYGRYLGEVYPPHTPFIEDLAITHTYRRVFLAPYSDFESPREAYDSTRVIYAEDVCHTPQELEEGVKRGGRWVTYSVWEMKNPPEEGWTRGGRGLGNDLVMVHGLGDYSLRYLPHIKYFLQAGFRVILPDLPSYGRSTGVHSYLPSLLLLTSALHVVLADVVQNDLAHGRTQRKVFLSGASMGGWTVLYYLLKFPPTSNAETVAAQAPRKDVSPPKQGSGKGYDQGERQCSNEKVRIQVAGAFVLCPMVEVSKDSRPSLILEQIGRAIVYFAGTLPLANAVRGNISDDPRVEEDFFADPLCYHGMLRVGTGLAALEGMIELQKRAGEINVPIRIVHGNKDRATSHIGTLQLFDRLPSHDKEIEIYDGYEHGK
nr:lysophospholipase [Cryptococcus depauperatus CBS 7855]